MVSTVAKYTFASLALSAKLHRMLERLSTLHQAREEQAFDTELEEALETIVREDPPLRDEARHEELRLLERDVAALEQLYHSYVERQFFSPDTVERFDRIFTHIKEKIEEKKLTV